MVWHTFAVWFIEHGSVQVAVIIVVEHVREQEGSGVGESGGVIKNMSVG